MNSASVAVLASPAAFTAAFGGKDVATYFPLAAFREKVAGPSSTHEKDSLAYICATSACKKPSSDGAHKHGPPSGANNNNQLNTSKHTLGLFGSYEVRTGLFISAGVTFRDEVYGDLANTRRFGSSKEVDMAVRHLANEHLELNAQLLNAADDQLYYPNGSTLDETQYPRRIHASAKYLFYNNANNYHLHSCYYGLSYKCFFNKLKEVKLIR